MRIAVNMVNLVAVQSILSRFLCVIRADETKNPETEIHLGGK